MSFSSLDADVLSVVYGYLDNDNVALLVCAIGDPTLVKSTGGSERRAWKSTLLKGLSTNLSLTRMIKSAQKRINSRVCRQCLAMCVSPYKTPFPRQRGVCQHCYRQNNAAISMATAQRCYGVHPSDIRNRLITAPFSMRTMMRIEDLERMWRYRRIERGKVLPKNEWY